MQGGKEPSSQHERLGTAASSTLLQKQNDHMGLPQNWGSSKSGANGTLRGTSLWDLQRAAASCGKQLPQAFFETLFPDRQPRP